MLKVYVLNKDGSIGMGGDLDDMMDWLLENVGIEQTDRMFLTWTSTKGWSVLPEHILGKIILLAGISAMFGE